MSITPIITFKAGKCQVDSSSKPYKVKPELQPGYVYLYSEDDLIHFCWRERNAPLDQPDLDLIMVPTDGHFVPYDAKNQPHATAKTNGRIFVLKFLSSSQRHFFWLQSKPQGRSGDPAWFSPRDRKIGEIVDALLQGEEVDVARQLASINNSDNDDRRDNNDDDETMEDVEGRGDPSDPHGGTGGAGPGATGGDIREEGESAREGGADGARAAAAGNVDAATAVRNFLNSLSGGAGGGGSGGSGGAGGKLYPMLSDLLPPPVTVPVIRTATEEQIDELLGFLPPAVLVIAQQGDDDDDAEGETEQPTAAAIEAARQAMSLGQKKALLEKVLRSPQFHQSLSSLTMAIRDGGLPSIADALAVDIENGGYVRGGRQVPLGGGEAVEAFVEGVKRTVQKKK